MMGSHTSSSSDNLSKILGLKPEFTQYLSGLIRGMCLENKTIMESTHPSGKVTISLTYSAGKFGKRREILRKGGKTGNSDFSSTNKKRHKPPSRRKRDQARFRAFVEKKKQIKLEKRKTELSRDINKHTSFQCPPPQEETITVAESPTVPINSVESTSKPQFTSAQSGPLLPPLQERSSDNSVANNSMQSQPGSPSTVNSDSEASPSESSWATEYDNEMSPTVPADSENIDPNTLSNPSSDPQSECECGYCTPTIQEIISFDPTKMFYACSYCQRLANLSENGLKQCSKCLSVAYCSKDCQRNDWKEGGHKLECTEEKAALVRQFRQNTLERKEEALHILRLHNCHLVQNLGQ